MKTSRQDWVDVGLRLLREDGQQALTVERLTNTIGRTKGSFYHHFENLTSYVQALLEWWERELTLRPIELASAESDPALRGKLLFSVVRDLDHRLDIAVRAWGQREGQVREVVQRVDQQRLACMAGLHRAAGRSKPDLRAYLEYAAFLGMQQLSPHPPGAERALHHLVTSEDL